MSMRPSSIRCLPVFADSLEVLSLYKSCKHPGPFRVAKVRVRRPYLSGGWLVTCSGGKCGIPEAKLLRQGFADRVRLIASITLKYPISDVRIAYGVPEKL